MQVALSFGALVPRISEQLSDQKLKAKTNNIIHWQRDADAITRLIIGGLLTDAQARNARRKLLKRIVSNVSPEE